MVWFDLTVIITVRKWRSIRIKIGLSRFFFKILHNKLKLQEDKKIFWLYYFERIQYKPFMGIPFVLPGKSLQNPQLEEDTPDKDVQDPQLG